MDLTLFKNKRGLRYSIIVLIILLVCLACLTVYLSNKATLSEKVSQSFLASTESIQHLTNLKTFVDVNQLRILNATNYNSVENYQFFLTYTARVEEFVDSIERNHASRVNANNYETGLNELTGELKNHLRLIEIVYDDYTDVLAHEALLVEKEAVFNDSMRDTLAQIQDSLITANVFQGTQSVALAQMQKEQIGIVSFVLILFLSFCVACFIYISYVYTLSQLHLRSLYRQSEHPIITLNKQERIVQFNQRASSLFTSSEIVRHRTHIKDLFGFQWDDIQKKLRGYPYKQSSFFSRDNRKTHKWPLLPDDRIEHTITLTNKDKSQAHYKLGIIVIRSLRSFRTVITFVDQTQLKSIEDKTHKDSFTNLTNKTGILNQLTSEIERAKRHHTALSVVFIDIDGFKGINDKYGHQFGDKVIKWVAKRISNRVRDTDFLGRFGGDEFILVCPDCRASQADSIAEDIRKLLKSPKLHIKASFGVAEMDPKDCRTSLLNRADKALYRAKSNGKDMVVVSQ